MVFHARITLILDQHLREKSRVQGLVSVYWDIIGMPQATFYHGPDTIF